MVIHGSWSFEGPSSSSCVAVTYTLFVHNTCYQKCQTSQGREKKSYRHASCPYVYLTECKRQEAKRKTRVNVFVEYSYSIFGIPNKTNFQISHVPVAQEDTIDQSKRMHSDVTCIYFNWNLIDWQINESQQ